VIFLVASALAIVSRIPVCLSSSIALVAGRTIFELLVISDGLVLVGRFTGFTFTISAERSVGFHGGRSFTSPRLLSAISPLRLLFKISFLGLVSDTHFTSGCIFLPDSLFNPFNVPVLINPDCATCFARNNDGSALNAR